MEKEFQQNLVLENNLRGAITTVIEKAASAEVDTPEKRFKNIEYALSVFFKTRLCSIEIRCDETNNSPGDIDNRVLNVDVKINYHEN